LTKIHEQFVRAPLSEIEIPEARGEMVLIIGPPIDHGVMQLQESSEQSISEEVRVLMRSERLDQKSALKRVARLRGLSKSEAYRRMMKEKRT